MKKKAIALACLVPLSLGVTAQERQDRIINGQKATIESHPWMALLTTKGQPPRDGAVCGASLIDPRWVVTAAHCVKDSKPDDLEVLLGTADITDTKGAERLSVLGILMPPGATEPQLFDSEVDDIALLKLATASNQTPIKLATAAQNAALSTGTSVVVSGWGNRSPTGSDYPRTLHEATVAITDPGECERQYDLEGLSERYLCAVDAKASRDTCDGDSGGPLSAVVDGVPTLFGVTSFGGEVCAGDKPGVYARVSRYEAFIADARTASVAIDPPVNWRPDIPGRSSTEALTLYNLTDSMPVTITGSRLDGDKAFALKKDACTDGEIPPADRCSVDIVWNAETPGRHAATFTTDGFDGATRRVLKASLSALALKPLENAAPLDLDGIAVHTDGTTVWTSSEDASAKGGSSLRTAEFARSDKVAILGVPVPGAGTLTFSYRGKNTTVGASPSPESDAETFTAEDRWKQASVRVRKPGTLLLGVRAGASDAVIELDRMSFAAGSSAPVEPPAPASATPVPGKPASGKPAPATSVPATSSGGGATAAWALFALGALTLGRRRVRPAPNGWSDA